MYVQLRRRSYQERANLECSSSATTSLLLCREELKTQKTYQKQAPPVGDRVGAATAQHVQGAAAAVALAAGVATAAERALQPVPAVAAVGRQPGVTATATSEGCQSNANLN
jgi:hypothetical protein